MTANKRRKYIYVVSALVAATIVILAGLLQSESVIILSEGSNPPPIPDVSVNASINGNSFNYSVYSSFFSGTYWVNLTDYAKAYNESTGIMHFRIIKTSQGTSFPYTGTSIALHNISISMTNRTTHATENFSSWTFTSDPFKTALSLKYNIMIQPGDSSINIIFKPPPKSLFMLGTRAELTLSLNIVVYSNLGPFHNSGRMFHLVKSDKLTIDR